MSHAGTIRNRSAGEYLFTGVTLTLLTLVAVLCLYPLLYVFFASISDSAQMMQHQGLVLYPLGFTLDSYARVLLNPMIATGYLNTLFYVVVGTLVNLALTILGAYGLSRKALLLKKQIMFIIVFTMFFSGGLIPLFLVVQRLNLINTRWAVIFPVAIETTNLIIMRTSFQAIPYGIEESVKIDGANDWVILTKIVIPLSMPVIAVMTLFYGVSRWNAWFNASIFLQDRVLYPLQIVLREILIINDNNSMLIGIASGTSNSVGETIKYATIIIATVPILTIYPFLQKYFVKGVMVGAIKG